VRALQICQRCREAGWPKAYCELHGKMLDQVKVKLQTYPVGYMEVDIEEKSNSVDHPNHYGGKDNAYEAIKVIEAWKLGFNLGNTLKYICRADNKNSKVENLQKARWYLDREIAKLKGEV
jgi:hypothetical protein